MTDYAPRNGQDLNPVFNNPHTHMSISQYTNGQGVSYVYNGSPVHYQTTNSSYPAYSTQFLPSQNGATNGLYPPPATMPLQYHRLPARLATVPSQPQSYRTSTYFPQAQMQRPQHLQIRSSRPPDSILMQETESQESTNESTMASEPMTPPLEGYPDVRDFDGLMKSYVDGLSPKKQDKALIHAKRAANIKTVLIDKKTTSVESAQFRFWVKKMFTLLPNDPQFNDRKRKICHEGKPVAIREKLFKILTRAHKQCQHGGRDKTSAEVRKVYSWVPKELISRFVKLCPTCQVRRGTARPSASSPMKSDPDSMEHSSPDAVSPNQSRRQSLATSQCSRNMHPPFPDMASFSPVFQSQNRWMAPLQTPQDSATRPPNSSYCIAPTTFQQSTTSSGLDQDTMMTDHDIHFPRPVTVPVTTPEYNSYNLRDGNEYHQSSSLPFGSRYSRKREPPL